MVLPLLLLLSDGISINKLITFKNSIQNLHCQVPILRLLVDEFARLKKVLEDSLHYGQQICLSPMSKANFSERVALNRIVVLLISFTVVLYSSGRISANTTSSFLNLFENFSAKVVNPCSNF